MKEEVMHWYVIIPSHILLAQTAGDKTRLTKHLSLNPTHMKLFLEHMLSLCKCKRLLSYLQPQYFIDFQQSWTFQEFWFQRFHFYNNLIRIKWIINSPTTRIRYMMLDTITITTIIITDMCCYTCYFFCSWFLFVFFFWYFLLYVLHFNICVNRSLNFLYSLRFVLVFTICKLITNTKFCICVHTLIAVFLLFINSFLSFQVIPLTEDNNESCR